MRAGDFGEFPTLIYDPFTATGTNATRTLFANNVIPTGRINAVAAAYAAYYPELPNRPGTNSNYFTNMLRPYDYNAVLGRVDHNFTPDRTVLFVNVYYNTRREDRYNWAQDARPTPPFGGLDQWLPRHAGLRLSQQHRRVTGGFTSVWSATTVVDVLG